MLPGVMPAFGDLTPRSWPTSPATCARTCRGEPTASPEVQDLYEEWATEAIENADAGELVYQQVPGDEEAVAERIDILSQEG